MPEDPRRPALSACLCGMAASGFSDKRGGSAFDPYEDRARERPCEPFQVGVIVVAFSRT